MAKHPAGEHHHTAASHHHAEAHHHRRADIITRAASTKRRSTTQRPPVSIARPRTNILRLRTRILISKLEPEAWGRRRPYLPPPRRRSAWRLFGSSGYGEIMRRQRSRPSEASRRVFHPRPAALIEIGDDPGLQIVDRRDDFQFALAGETGKERARRGQPSRRSLARSPWRRCRRSRPGRSAPRARPAGSARSSGRSRRDRSRSWSRRRRPPSPRRSGVGEDDDEGRAQHRRAVFDRAQRRGVDEIAGVPGDEQFADPMAAEDQLRRHAAVGAAMIVAQGAWCPATAMRPAQDRSSRAPDG